MPFDSPRSLLTLSLLTCALLTAPAASAQSDGETESSTAAVPLPDQGGPLPRAPMPMGGHDDGSQDALEARMKAKEAAKQKAAEAKAKAKAEAKAAEDKAKAAGDEAKEKAKASDLPQATSEIAKDKPRAATSFGTAAAENVVGGIALRWNGYLRLAAEVTENDSKSAFIGRNDGFKLANARLGLQARKADFSAYVSIEAAAGERETFNDPNPTFRVMPRDAYLRYEVSKFAQVTAGRFKTPYDLSSLEATALRTFISRPIESRGVLPTQGFEVDGLATDRQLGIMIHQEHLGLDLAGFDFGYALALTNGFARNFAFNDNDRPAAFLRLSAYWDEYIAVNVAGFADTRTTGDLPDLFDEDVKGVEASLLAHAFGFAIEGQFLFQTTDFETSGQPRVDSWGGHAQVAYTIYGITAAYRFAFLDPNLDDIEDADRVIEHTLGVSYGLENIPLRLMLNGTVAQEQAGRKLSNNRLTLLGQFIF